MHITLTYNNRDSDKVTVLYLSASRDSPLTPVEAMGRAGRFTAVPYYPPMGLVGFYFKGN